ncbi:hypothetical protein GQ602_005050 [Ophiocordyceps camponoti-floridani]|uniref:Uncharacterized protein n=1 Tax=Ophiocordyceps camponoti-floridani TaxID=2030778 RepID=A0A8H4Q5F6_9HYPO|nr:hypothetical protein GQ602_005050 [Ophiocordyceps camponoti-floridani]
MLLLSLFVIGASALTYQCSSEFHPDGLERVFLALDTCGTPLDRDSQKCFEERMASTYRLLTNVGYQMADWEAATQTNFASLRYMTYRDSQRGETWWQSIIKLAAAGHGFCWYVRDSSPDQHTDGFSNNLGSVFFADNHLREPIMHVATDTRKLDVRRGSHCFTPDTFFKQSRLAAIQKLLTDYTEELRPTLYQQSYRSLRARMSTDLAMTAILVRLAGNYKCPARGGCADELEPGRPYLPKSPKDLLRQLASIIGKDGVFCLFESIPKFPAKKWYYLTGFGYNYV